MTVLYVSPSDDDHLFVGTSNLLLKSTDRGETWKSLSDTFHRSDIKGLAIHPNNPNIIYVRIGLYTFSDCSDVDNDDPDYEESVSKYCPVFIKVLMEVKTGNYSMTLPETLQKVVCI